MLPTQCVEVGDFEIPAREAMSAMAYAYFAAGANDEFTLKDNRDAYRRIRLLPRMLVDVSRMDLRTRVLGIPLSWPLLIAPTAFHRLAHPDGELATARAARAAGVGMVESSIASTSLEDVAACGPDPRWFQLYVLKDRELSRRMVARAEAAGYSALVLTVDAPRFGCRYADVRDHFTLPEGITMPNFADGGAVQMDPNAPGSGLAAYAMSLFDASLTWKDVTWLRSITRLPILVKGILRADDALRAIEHGAHGVVVSNHGGRQLDTVPATIDALGPIVEAVGEQGEVLVDGGIRRGTDILKALALGAKAVLVGRPILWGLGAGGQQGVEQVLALLRQEFDLACSLAGCPTIASIHRSLLLLPGEKP